MPNKRQKKKKNDTQNKPRPTEKKRREEVERYNALFDELIIDTELGIITVEEKEVSDTKRIYTNDEGEIIKEVNTEGREGRVYSDWIKTPISRTIERDGKIIDYYKMAFEEPKKEEDNIFSLCRKQLPRNWFVCRNGEVLEYKDKEWFWRKNKKEDRRILEALETKVFPKSKNGKKARLYSKQYDVYKPKGLAQKETIDGTQLESYTLTGIVFGARVFGEKTKEIIKKKGLLAFLAKNGVQGHHTRGYRYDEEFKYTYEQNMEYNNNPDYILFISHKLHEEIYKVILGLNSDITEEELNYFRESLDLLFKEENPDKAYVILFYPKYKENDISIEDLENYHFYVEKKVEGINKIQISANKTEYIDILEIELTDKTRPYYEALVCLQEYGIEYCLNLNINQSKYKIQYVGGSKNKYLRFLEAILTGDKTAEFIAQTENMYRLTMYKEFVFSPSEGLDVAVIMEGKENE